jgi:hypothetical protein
MNTKELIEQAILLPVEDRALMVDSLLRSLNQPESEIDKKWSVVARKRLDELRSGLVTSVQGDKVFKNVRERFEKA